MASSAHKHYQSSEEHEKADLHGTDAILTWHAPGRPFKKHSKQFYINVLLITTALEIIIFLFHGYLVMLVVAALVFLSFALAYIPPHIFYYKITSEGILVEDTFFIWDELYDFYFWKEKGQDVLHIGTKSYFPGEIILNLGEEITIEETKHALLPFLPFREYVKPSFMDKAGSWIEKTFPLEKPQ